MSLTRYIVPVRPRVVLSHLGALAVVVGILFAVSAAAALALGLEETNG